MAAPGYWCDNPYTALPVGQRMHIHILGICGTFMGSLAQLAAAEGYRVTGSDANVYPPMSTQLAQAGIEITEGYDAAQLQPAPDLVVVGNALSRGNPCVEYLLNAGLPYISGPQWLGDHFLPGKHVLAVAGTHGKTTTASMLAWILEYAGRSPGFLIGGVPQNFGVSARLGTTPLFVVEADEYDTAFFDKRSKFVHYHPRTLVLNNLEFDHGDIFPDLAAIETQFHHLLRTVPAQGLVVVPQDDANLAAVLQRGCWTPVETTGGKGQWRANLLANDGSAFEILCNDSVVGRVDWQQTGDHSVANGLMAVAAAHHVGVAAKQACAGLSQFRGVKRRMEALGSFAGIHVYDDFAHHPTAIATTLRGLRNKVGTEKIIAVIEPRSNTMKMGVHRAELTTATRDASFVLWYQSPDMDWSLREVVDGAEVPSKVVSDMEQLIEETLMEAGENAHIVIMSNGGFGDFHARLLARLGQHDGRVENVVGAEQYDGQ